MVYAEFGGQTECIMGSWKIENAVCVKVYRNVPRLFLEEATTRSLHVRKSKTVLEPSGEGARHAVDSGGFQVLQYGRCRWNLDSGSQSLMVPDFFKLYSGFHSPGFQVP